MRKNKIILGLLVCIVMVSFIFLGTLKTYKLEDEKEEIKKVKNDIALFLIDENGNETETDEFPDPSEYYLDTEKSSCENGSEINWDTATGNVEITTTKSDSCVIYFKKGQYVLTLEEALLAQYGGEGSINTLTTISGVTVDGEYGLYKAPDDYGDSYYFRGDVSNNYVKFGNDSSGNSMYWRIIRINGDGTIRMIYDGTSALNNGITRDINSFTLLESLDSEDYSSSNLRDSVELWYETNLQTNYASFLEDRIFCNSKETVFSSNDFTFECPNDYEYTVDGGNLSYPIGLVTAEEYVMSGGYVDISNNTHYLYSGFEYFTLTAESAGFYYFIENDGRLYIDNTDKNPYYVRPVINLKADIEFTYNNEETAGTVSDPYVITTN